MNILNQFKLPDNRTIIIQLQFIKSKLNQKLYSFFFIIFYYNLLNFAILAQEFLAVAINKEKCIIIKKNA